MSEGCLFLSTFRGEAEGMNRKKNVLSPMKKCQTNRNGFSLVELIVVMAILGILALIAVPLVGGFRVLAKERVCETNRRQIERLFAAQLEMIFEADEQGDRNILFQTYMLETGQGGCPAGGEYTYDSLSGQVGCSVHAQGDDEGDHDDPGEVPYL